MEIILEKMNKLKGSGEIVINYNRVKNFINLEEGIYHVFCSFINGNKVKKSGLINSLNQLTGIPKDFLVSITGEQKKQLKKELFRLIDTYTAQNNENRILYWYYDTNIRLKEERLEELFNVEDEEYHYISKAEIHESFELIKDIVKSYSDFYYFDENQSENTIFSLLDKILAYLEKKHVLYFHFQLINEEKLKCLCRNNELLYNKVREKVKEWYNKNNITLSINQLTDFQSFAYFLSKDEAYMYLKNFEDQIHTLVDGVQTNKNQYNSLKTLENIEENSEKLVEVRNWYERTFRS